MSSPRPACCDGARGRADLPLFSGRSRTITQERVEQLTKMYYAIKDKERVDKFEAGRGRSGLRSAGRRGAAAEQQEREEGQEGGDQEELQEFIREHATEER